MWDFIFKYWVEVFFGLVVSGLGFACRRYCKLWKAEQNHQKTEEQKAFYDGILDKIDERCDSLQKGIDSLTERMDKAEEKNSILTEGLLSVQGANFKRQCKKLLEENHQITEAEWLQLEKDYEAYEKLGGNGAGHEMFDAIAHKYYNYSN